MRKLTESLVTASLILAMSGAACAGDGDVHFSLGYKAWMNQWATSNAYDSPEVGTRISSNLSTGTQFSSIPNVALKVGDFFLSGSYFLSQTYTFPTELNPVLPTTGSGYLVNTNLTAKRKEADVAIGYYLHPSISIFAGFKQVTQDYSSSYTATGYIPWSGSSTTTIKGPTIGINGGVTLDNGFGVYGSFAYGWLKSTYNDSTDKDNASYVNSEFGFNYHAAGVPLVYSIGYRSQIIKTTMTSNSTLVGPDITNGMVVGINISF